jgi:hypothetical protein
MRPGTSKTWSVHGANHRQVSSAAASRSRIPIRSPFRLRRSSFCLGTDRRSGLASSVPDAKESSPENEPSWDQNGPMPLPIPAGHAQDKSNGHHHNTPYERSPVRMSCCRRTHGSHAAMVDLVPSSARSNIGTVLSIARSATGSLTGQRSATGRRADAVNIRTREVIELKPNNPRKIREGNKQLQGYIDELNNMYPTGPRFTGRVETYDRP